jgi:hypothetical protein
MRCANTRGAVYLEGGGDGARAFLAPHHAVTVVARGESTLPQGRNEARRTPSLRVESRSGWVSARNGSARGAVLGPLRHHYI